MKSENDNIFYFMDQSQKEIIKEKICKWKNETCKSCHENDPFKTQSYCYIAVKLYFADNNTLCPKCASGYLKMTKEHTFRCPSCDYTTDYSLVIKRQKKLNKVCNLSQDYFLDIKKYLSKF